MAYTLAPTGNQILNERGDIVASKQQGETNFSNVTDSSGNVLTGVSGGELSFAKPTSPEVSPTVSPSVISSQSASDSIPEIQDRIKQAQNQGGTYQDQTGALRYNYDGSLVSAPMGAERTPGGQYQIPGQETIFYGAPPRVTGDPTQDALIQGQFDLLDSLRASVDTQTASQIQSINASYAARKQIMEDINMRSKAAQEQSLLIGGSSRYAPLSSQAIVTDEERYGAMQLAQLDALRQSAISEAQQAASKQKWDIAQVKMNEYDKIQERLFNATKEHNEKVFEHNQKLADQKAEADRDIAISQVISDEKLTDAEKIMKRLKEKGISVTAKDVENVFDAIAKKVGTNWNGVTNAIEAFGKLKNDPKGNQLPTDIRSLANEGEQILAFAKRYKEATEGTGNLKWQKVGTDKFGDDVYGFVNEKTGEITYPGGKAQGKTVSGKKGAVAGVTATPDEYKDFLKDKTPEQVRRFNSLSDEEKTNVMGLISGDILLSDIAKGGIKGTKAAQVYNAEAAQIDSTYSQTANKQRYQFKIKWNDSNGKAYQTRTGVNTALGHLSRLKELTDGLVNNGDFQKANNLGNWISANINSKKKSDPKDPNSPTVAEVIGQFQDTVDLLAMEIARAYKGGVPDQHEIDRQVNSINSMQPKNVLTSIINNKVNLMSGLLASQGEEYKKVMGKYPTESIVNMDALNSLKSAGVDTSKLEEKIKHQLPNIEIPLGPTSDNPLNLGKSIEPSAKNPLGL